MDKLAQAQRQYDAQLPDDYAGPECHKCGTEMLITSRKSGATFSAYTAWCPDCGAKADYDSRVD